MYYLNLPLQIWKYVILFVSIVTIIVTIMVFRNENIDSFARFIVVWLCILLLLNFANMYYTINNYMKYSIVIGKKGPKGDFGPRGYRGNSFVCNMCGDGGKEDKLVYGSNVNDQDQVIEDEKLMAGKCKFPFIHNNEFQYDCTTEPREPGKINDASIYGWCATSTNNDLSYKTFGYCKNSEIEKRRFESRKTRGANLQNYQETNYGVLDIDIVENNISEAKCPSGYSLIDVDLNENTTGKYIYMCVKKGLDDFGISDLSISTEGTSCPGGYSLIDVDLNEGIANAPVKICKKKASRDFIKDIKIVKQQKCPNGYTLVEGNLNHGVSGTPLYMCINKERVDNSKVVDTAFVYGPDNTLYFFRNDLFWKYSDKLNRVEDGYPLKISQFWGKLPSQIDAVMTYPYDNETYFFKGDVFWKYDAKKSKLANGYPKPIKTHWKGIPDDLDAIYIKNRKTYFIKKDLYFLYDDKKKRVKKGYPKKIINKFPNAPSFPSAVFYYPYKEKTYYLVGSEIKVYKNGKETSDSPKNLADSFMGII